MAEQIRSGELLPGVRVPPGDQLAKTLGVDRNVAHRAVEQLQREGLVIRKRGKGTVVAEWETNKTHKVVLLVDGYSAYHNFPSGDLLRGIQDELGEDSALVIADSKHDSAIEARHLRRLANETDGLLIYATELNKPYALASLVENGFPVVALDRLPHDIQVNSVMTDNFASTQAIIQDLIKQGHRRIGYFSLHRPEFSSVTDRHRGFIAAMSEAGLESESLVRWLPANPTITPQVFNQIVQDSLAALRNGPDGITALFCAEDLVGCSVVVACEHLEINRPDDLALATFNDWHPMTLRTPWSIHRVIQRKYELGQAAAHLLLERIKDPSLPPRSVLVEAELVSADAGLKESYSSLTF